MPPVNEEKIKKELYTLVAIIAVLITIAIIVLAYFYVVLFSSRPSTSITAPSNNVVVPTPMPTLSILNSSFGNNTIPSNMAPGQTYPVTIIAQNTGDVPWSNDTTFIAQYFNDSTDQTSFSSTSTLPPGTIINNGGQYTWAFSMTAPTWNGNYTIAYQMRNTTTTFGDVLVKNITVGTPGANVIFTYIDLPYTMRANSKVNVTVIVQNKGKDPWFEDDDVQLGINYTPNDGSSFTRTIRLHMNPDSGVMPGDTCKWVYPLTAPSYSTQYTVTYQMVKGNDYFGAPMTRTVQITN